MQRRFPRAAERHHRPELYQGELLPSPRLRHDRPVTEVSTCTAVALPSCPTVADASGNIMQVSVQGLSITALVPRIFGPGKAADNAPLWSPYIRRTLSSPTTNPPPVGTAP